MAAPIAQVEYSAKSQNICPEKTKVPIQAVKNPDSNGFIGY